MLRWIWLAVVILLLDQVTKQIALAQLTLHEPVTLLPFLNFTLVYNKGAAFGFLSSASGWQNAFFIVVALIACGVILYLLRQSRERMFSVALVLVLGGAIGNLVDRFIYGYVIDFVDVYYQSWHWPAFNIADSAITVGALLLVFNTLQPATRTHS